jgi:hypothetical protein
VVNGGRRIASLPIAIVVLLSVGCYSPTPEDLPRAAVSGTVFLDGKPLDGIEIVFESDPVPPSNRIRAVYATIHQGHYVIDAVDGPAVGNAKVRLLDIPVSREQMEADLNESNKDPRRGLHPPSYPVPEKFASGSTLQVLIEPDVLNEHDFDLKTR